MAEIAMRKIRGFWFVVSILTLLFYAVVALFYLHYSHRHPEDSKVPVILAFNDTYRIHGIADGSRGGLARFRHLRAELEDAGNDVLVLHAGDFLAPSFLSRGFKGEDDGTILKLNGRQMVDIMNMLDGDSGAGTYDNRLIATLGNHEFDESECEKPAPLRNRIRESEFIWIASNIGFDKCRGQATMLADAFVARHWIDTVGGIRVGVYALLLPFDEKDQAKQPEIRDVIETSRRMVRKLRGLGAEFVIALSHQDWQDDQKLLGHGVGSPDLIAGGHDHERMALSRNQELGKSAPDDEPTKIYKADADALSVSVFTLSRADKSISFDHRFEILGPNFPKNTEVSRKIDQWLSKHETAFCMRMKEEAANPKKKEPDPATGPSLLLVEKSTEDSSAFHDLCLHQRLATAATNIEAEESKNRRQETNLGNWLTDMMRGKVDPNGVAILNSGSLRLNYDLDKGSDITRRHVEELFAYPAPLVKFSVKGSDLWKIMAKVLKKRTDGAWPHFNGMAVKLDANDALIDLIVQTGANQYLRVDSGTTTDVTVITIPYLACGKDGYDFPVAQEYDNCPDLNLPKYNLASDSEVPDLKLLAYAALRDAETAGKGVSMELVGRVCDEVQQRCELYDEWNKALGEK